MPDSHYATPGRALRALRLGVGVSLRDLALEAHLSPSHLSRIERGERDVPQVTFVRLTSALADIAHRKGRAA